MRLERRIDASPALLFAAPLAAIAVSLAISGILIGLAGVNPISAYGEMVRGAFGSRLSISETLTRATPLMLTGLAAAVAFRARLWNIGAEGQLYAGALAAAWLGHNVVAGLPPVVAIIAIMAAGMVVGALLLLGPVLLRLRLGVDEVVTTLLLNFIILLGSVSEVYAWAADCCGEAGPRRCPPDHADEMEPSQIAVQVLRGDAAIAAQETLQLAVAAIDRLNVEGIPDPLSGRKVQGFVANAHGRSAGRIAAMTVRNQNDVGIQNRFEHRLQGLGVDRRKNLADGCAAAIGGDQDRHLFIRQAALAGLAATLARLAIQSARSLVALKHVSLVNFDNALEFRPILACGLQETVPPAEGRIDAKSASTGRFPYRLALGQRHAE